jgi:hypothetical protein
MVIYCMCRSQSLIFSNNNLYFQGHKQTILYIITQLPLADTIGDFWWMIFSEKCSSIVMLDGISADSAVSCIESCLKQIRKVVLIFRRVSLSVVLFTQIITSTNVRSCHAVIQQQNLFIRLCPH